MLCRCGCGQETKTAARTRGNVKKGDPQPYIRGHWAKGQRADVAPPNPAGICQCGCGQPAPIARMTSVKHGYVAGEPMRYIRGHVGFTIKRERLTDDLWNIENRGYDTPCWIWKGAPSSEAAAYGRIKFQGKVLFAHRAMYEQEIGPIPKGLHIDHLCRQTMCVNPAHLEPVTSGENIRRGYAAKRKREAAALADEHVEMVRASTLKPSIVAKLMGISEPHVRAIREGRPWE